MNSKAKNKTPDNRIAVNRRARHDYFIEETYEAGMVLQGWEVKSLRTGHAQLQESYIILRDGEAFLFGSHIPPLNTASTHITTDPLRTRKLLLNRRELSQLVGLVDRKGYTIVPLDLHWKRGRAKLTIGLAKGKQGHDKRADQKKKDWQREKSRILKTSHR